MVMITLMTDAAVDAWWSPSSAGLVGGIAGSLIGLLGATIGCLTSAGRARSLVMTLLTIMLVVGLVAFPAGIVALILSQPYAVYYPLLLMGLLGTTLPLTLRGGVKRRFEALELRRMEALDG